MNKRMLAAVLSLCLMALALPALASPAMQAMTFGPFEAENLRGEDAVTEAIFADADVTLVNYWATWCGPCRVELPDLAKLSELSEGRVQVLGVLLDSLNTATGVQDAGAIETAHILLDDAGAEFPVVVPDEWLLGMTRMVTGVPTTFLVDGNGKLLKVHVGSQNADAWLALAEQYYPDAK